jgi:hypothetical protein
VLVIALAGLALRRSRGQSRRPVNLNAFHPGEIDHHTAVADSLASDAVPATADRQWQLVTPGQVDRVDDISRATVVVAYLGSSLRGSGPIDGRLMVLLLAGAGGGHEEAVD